MNLFINTNVLLNFFHYSCKRRNFFVSAER